MTRLRPWATGACFALLVAACEPETGNPGGSGGTSPTGGTTGTTGGTTSTGGRSTGGTSSPTGGTSPGTGGVMGTGGSSAANTLVTSASGAYWKTGTWTEVTSTATVTVNDATNYQTWDGFGGAFNEIK